MYLTDLAKVCRQAGLKVEEVSGWQSRGHGPLTSVNSIICHHTAGPATGNMPSLGVVTYGRSDLPGPLCNLGLGRDGTVYVVAAGYAYHAGAVSSSTYGNTRSIGIEAEATGVSAWPKVQMDAYARLCRALAKHYGVPTSRVLGHKEVASPRGRKIDPNFDMDAFRKSVDAAAPQTKRYEAVRGAADRVKRAKQTARRQGDRADARVLKQQESALRRLYRKLRRR